MKVSVAVFWASIVTAVLSVCAVVSVIKLLVVPQLGSRSAVALCTISHVYMTSRNCVHVTVGYMTADGSFAEGRILPYAKRNKTGSPDECFCRDCLQEIEGNMTEVVHPQHRLFKMSKPTLCLFDIPQPANSSDLPQYSPTKPAILLPTLIFVTAFVSCFISAIYTCKDRHLEEEKARRLKRQSWV